MQSKKMSIIESISNVAIGYIVAIVAQVIVFPIFDINIKPQDHILIGLLFTIVSLVRSYVLRRLFNKLRG